jgi:hypothetical protein
MCFASSRIYLCPDNLFAHVTMQKSGSNCKSSQIWGSSHAFQAAKKNRGCSLACWYCIPTVSFPDNHCAGHNPHGTGQTPGSWDRFRGGAFEIQGRMVTVTNTPHTSTMTQNLRWFMHKVGDQRSVADDPTLIAVFNYVFPDKS